MTVVSDWIPTTHHSSRRGRDIEAVIVHFTGGGGDSVALGKFFQRKRKSSHYGISRDGRVSQYVSETRSAWHAGDGALPADFCDAQGYMSDVVNPRTIGIELCNRGPLHTKNVAIEARHRNPRVRHSVYHHWEVYPPAQLHSLGLLCQEIMARHKSCRYVLGHEDATNYVTAGGSKVDPGPIFPWEVPVAAGLTRVMFDFEAEEFVIA